MGNSIYLTLSGKEQGLISSGCLSIESVGNKAQPTHRDQIFIYSISRSVSRGQHVNHHPVVFKKPIDKSSPLLGIALNNNELLEAKFDYYRTSQEGMQQLYYTVKIYEATIAELSEINAHSIISTGTQPEKTVMLRYKSISWQHHIAGTSGYSIWDDRVY